MKDKLQRCNLLWRIIERALALLDRCLPPPQVIFHYKVGRPMLKPTLTHTQPNPTMDITTTNEEQIPITLNPRTTQGHPVEVQNPEWTVLDGPSTIVPSEDGKSCMFVSSDEANTVTSVKIKADADLGDGVIPIEDVIVYTVTHANASSLGLQSGPVQPKPTPPESKG